MTMPFPGSYAASDRSNLKPRRQAMRMDARRWPSLERSRRQLKRPVNLGSCDCSDGGLAMKKSVSSMQIGCRLDADPRRCSHRGAGGDRKPAGRDRRGDVCSPRLTVDPGVKCCSDSGRALPISRCSREQRRWRRNRQPGDGRGSRAKATDSSVPHALPLYSSNQIWCGSPRGLPSADRGDDEHPEPPFERGIKPGTLAVDEDNCSPSAPMAQN